MKLKINPAFKDLIRPLTEEEYQLLEDNIKKRGLWTINLDGETLMWSRGLNLRG
jgi:hypothetical protein